MKRSFGLDTLPTSSPDVTNHSIPIRTRVVSYANVEYGPPGSSSFVDYIPSMTNNNIIDKGSIKVGKSSQSDKDEMMHMDAEPSSFEMDEITLVEMEPVTPTPPPSCTNDDEPMSPGVDESSSIRSASPEFSLDQLMDVDAASPPRLIFDENQTSLEELPVDFDELSSQELQTKIHALHKFSKYFPILNGVKRLKLLEHLRNLLHDDREKDVKSLAIILMEKLANEPPIDCAKIFEILDDFMNHINSNSTEIKCCIYNSIRKILKIESVHSSPLILQTIKSLCVYAYVDLTDSHYSIRSACIGLLSSLVPIINQIERNNDQNFGEVLDELKGLQIRDVIRRFGSDPDPRVRSASLKALLQLHLRGCKLDRSLYNMCVTCLSDDYEEVRIEALSLIWVLSTIYPEHMTTYVLDDGKTQQIRLLDDAFIKICDMVYDGSVKVRKMLKLALVSKQACTIMGSYRQVGETILLETLSQEVISQGKSRKSNQGYGKNKKSRFIPTPEGDLDVESEEFRLLKSNVCGAFIHGLEDAYQDVRNAAIDSICQLCMYNQKFSKKSVEFLVDMFQDEIDSVRLNSINSLHKIGVKYPIELDSELLQITVGVLNDTDPMVRKSTHGMLGVAKLKSQELIPQFVDFLISSMNKYPEDQLSIYRCFKNVGLAHGDYIEYYVPMFFKMESTYISREIKQNDPQHIGNLILAFNASTTNPKILSMLPDYAGRHYEYLRIKFPDCFPDVNISGDSPTQAVQIDQSDTDDYMLSFMGITLKEIRSLGHMLKYRNFKSANRVITSCKSNMEYISHVPSLAGNAKFCINYLECLRLLIKANQHYMEANSSYTEPHIASQLMALSYTMEYGYLGLNASVPDFLSQIRIIAHLIWLYNCMTEKSDSNGMSEKQQTLIRGFNKRIKDLERKFESHTLLKEMNKVRAKLEKFQADPSFKNATRLFDYISEFNLFDIGIIKNIKVSEAIITQPTSNPTMPIDFQSQFPLSINIEAEIHEVNDPSSLAIQVIFPDQSTQHFNSSSGLVSTRHNHYKLKTQIDVSQTAWTGKLQNFSLRSRANLRIVREYQPDIPDVDTYIMRLTAGGIITGAISECTLSLSEPVKFFIWPRDSSSYRMRNRSRHQMIQAATVKIDDPHCMSRSRLVDKMI
ncbi:2471_t:CDS:10 [Acaulospora morrowiae]|uniref:2471_t:CDS:1 n=1 Tax=Acaulospora morrowiae TaxID=94023 RepID=A0A9N8WRK7_9GLOM|nr:2471_t:CDS:10 [Acaulospora morrowiae]